MDESAMENLMPSHSSLTLLKPAPLTGALSGLPWGGFFPQTTQTLLLPILLRFYCVFPLGSLPPIPTCLCPSQARVPSSSLSCKKSSQISQPANFHWAPTLSGVAGGGVQVKHIGVCPEDPQPWNRRRARSAGPAGQFAPCWASEAGEERGNAGLGNSPWTIPRRGREVAFVEWLLCVPGPGVHDFLREFSWLQLRRVLG